MSKQSGAQNISHAQGASSSRKEFTTNVRPELSRVFTDYSRLFDPDSRGRTITLPEINIWMLAANIIDGRKISEQDTKEVFSLFRKDSLNFAQFNEFLDNLARETGANSDTFRMNLISCGAPKYESSVCKTIRKKNQFKKNQGIKESARITVRKHKINMAKFSIFISFWKLQAENRQLKYKCEQLEKECNKLADQLICDQVKYYTEKEENFVLKTKFEEASDNLIETSLILHAYKQNSLSVAEDMIQCLQKELIKVRLTEAENDALKRELQNYIRKLEEDKKILRETAPDNCVAHLQEELIAVKLREAEADLSLKDLRQKLSELSTKCHQYIQKYSSEVEVQIAPKKLMFWDNKIQDTQ